MKNTIIEKLNNGVNPKELGFERAADDGASALFVKKWGAGFMQINCTYMDDEPDIFDDDISGWNNE